jgi:3-hydroxyisobutyrate dehydrogenase
MANETIGFIGIGKMGWPMAANLVKAGYTVLPWDTNAAARARFAMEHGTSEPQKLVELADASIIITMLPTGADVRRVMAEGDSGGLMAVLRKGTVLIDMSSSDSRGGARETRDRHDRRAGVGRRRRSDRRHAHDHDRR